MAEDHIRYDLLVREALRGVVKRIVADVAKNGLPGEHHFYISFDTNAPGVRISPRLKAKYPEEMTIVLQHQFWDLAATDSGIEVGLSFDRIPEKLAVPFEAIKGFFDPSVQFGLEFESGEKAANDQVKAETKPSATAPALAPPEERTRRKPARESRPKPEAEASKETEKAEKPAETPRQGGAEVVKLDRFRKK